MARARVRPFERDDIPRVAALRQRRFSSSPHQSATGIEEYFDQVFFSNPWRDLDLPSLLCEDETGQCTGFLGVIPRPVRYRGESLRMAVSTHFMAEPGNAAIKLLSCFMDGPQDLCYTDAANDASRRLWEGIGGTTAVAHSLRWSVKLRPIRHALSYLGDHAMVRAARLLVRPLVTAGDAALRAVSSTQRRIEPPAGLTTTALDARDVVELLPAMTEQYSLVPIYDEASARWLLERTADRNGPESVRSRLVRSADGLPIGWYIYERRGILGEVVQIAARPDHWTEVLRTLLTEARHDGLGAVSGALEPRHAAEVAAISNAFTWQGPCSLTHSRRPELALATLAGDAFLSRLEAEWWLNW